MFCVILNVEFVFRTAETMLMRLRSEVVLQKVLDEILNEFYDWKE